MHRNYISVTNNETMVLNKISISAVIIFNIFTASIVSMRVWDTAVFSCILIHRTVLVHMQLSLQMNFKIHQRKQLPCI